MWIPCEGSKRNVPGTDTSRPTLRGERARQDHIRTCGGSRCQKTTVVWERVRTKNTNITFPTGTHHHDRGFHLSRLGEDEGRKRICDGNNAPPENKTQNKNADMKSPHPPANVRSGEQSAHREPTTSSPVNNPGGALPYNECNLFFFFSSSSLVAYRHLRMALPRSRLNPGR